MSVDARIRKGLTMIEKELPGVDTLEEYENLERRIRRGDRRRLALIAAAAAVVLAAAASAVLLNQGDEKKVSPAPSPDLPNRVMIYDGGSVSYVAGDGSRHMLPALNIDRLALSPDGHRIAYTNFKNTLSPRALWIANADGTDPQRLPAPCAGCQPGYGVTWSHDGTRLAYVAWTPGKQPVQVRVRTLATGHERMFEMPSGLEPRGPMYSPDDRTLAVNLVGDSGQYVAAFRPAQGMSSLRQLSPEYSQVQAPAWSADGHTVYYTATTQGDNTTDVTARNDVYAVGADGSGDRQITHAAEGERFFGAMPYQDLFLTSRIRGDGPWMVGWLSSDGRTFTQMRGPDGKPVLGNGALLQP